MENRSTLPGNFLFKRDTWMKKKCKCLSFCMERQPKQKQETKPFLAGAFSNNPRNCEKWQWSERSGFPSLAGVNQGYGFQWIYLWANLLFSQKKAFVSEDVFATGYWVLYMNYWVKFPWLYSANILLTRMISVHFLW